MKEITYRRAGDYLLPNLIPPESPKIGIWGMRRRDYLKSIRPPFIPDAAVRKLNAHMEGDRPHG